MVKNQGSRTGKVFRGLFNVRLWLDWTRVKSSTLYLGQVAKRLFVPNPQKTKESFSEAMVRLKLSEADVLKKQKGLWRLSLIMCLSSILLLIYGVFHVAKGHFASGIISFTVMGVAGVLAIRYHFWYFQIKSRKLGCSFHEWFRVGIMGDKP